MYSKTEYPFTHGVYQTREVMHEFVHAVLNHPDTIMGDFNDARLIKDIPISYNNLTILVTEIKLDTTCDFEEVQFVHTISFSIENEKFRYVLTLIDAEFIKLLMESL